MINSIKHEKSPFRMYYSSKNLSVKTKNKIKLHKRRQFDIKKNFLLNFYLVFGQFGPVSVPLSQDLNYDLDFLDCAKHAKISTLKKISQFLLACNFLVVQKKEDF